MNIQIDWVNFINVILDDTWKKSRRKARVMTFAWRKQIIWVKNRQIRMGKGECYHECKNLRRREMNASAASSM